MPLVAISGREEGTAAISGRGKGTGTSASESRECTGTVPNVQQWLVPTQTRCALGNLARASLVVMLAGEPYDGPIMEVMARIRIMRAVIAKANPRAPTLLLPDVPALTAQGAQPFLLGRCARRGPPADDNDARWCDNEVSPLRAARSQLSAQIPKRARGNAASARSISDTSQPADNSQQATYERKPPTRFRYPTYPH